MKEIIKSSFENYGIVLTDKQVEQFENYYNFLVEENEKYNLTAITEKNEVAIKHFVDSVLPYKTIPQNASIIDVGTGAGFPGVPLKILREDLKLTLLDSLQKRVRFLEELTHKLELKNVTCVHARAEDYCREKREKFDVATSRAVAATNTLSEYLIPYVKKGGLVLMYKGSKAEEELKEGEKSIKTLGGKVSLIQKFFLKEVESERNVVVIEKLFPTPSKFPRGNNLPKTKPIV